LANPQAKGVATVIVVFVPARNPPRVFESTLAELVLMANSSDESTHTQSIPPGTPDGAFETAWAILTKDLHCAKLFKDIDEARSHYGDNPDGLTVQQHAAILTGLARLERVIGTRDK
jgi:hypothetical protein